MREWFPVVGVLLVAGSLFLLTIEGAYQGEANRCPARWHSDKNVWFGCEGEVFERKLAKFKKGLPADWRVISITEHPPEAGYARGTTVVFSD